MSKRSSATTGLPWTSSIEPQPKLLYTKMSWKEAGIGLLVVAVPCTVKMLTGEPLHIIPKIVLAIVLWYGVSKVARSWKQRLAFTRHLDLYPSQTTYWVGPRIGCYLATLLPILAAVAFLVFA